MTNAAVIPSKTSEFSLVRAEQGIVFPRIHGKPVIGIGVIWVEVKHKEKSLSFKCNDQIGLIRLHMLA